MRTWNAVEQVEDSTLLATTGTHVFSLGMVHEQGGTCVQRFD